MDVTQYSTVLGETVQSLTLVAGVRLQCAACQIGLHLSGVGFSHSLLLVHTFQTHFP